MNTSIVSSTKKRIIPPSEYQAWWWNYLAKTAQRKAYERQCWHEEMAKQQKGRG